MRSLLLIPLLLLSFGLAGCATPGTTSSTTLPPAVTDTVVQIKDAVKSACGYEPTLETISNVLSGIGVPYIGMVSTVANQICSVVTKFGARRGGVRMMAVKHSVTGAVTPVAIKGRFVR